MTYYRSVRTPTAKWDINVGTILSPLRVWDGWQWRVFAGGPFQGLSNFLPGPGPGAIYVWHESRWILFAAEGWQVARVHGKVMSISSGMPIYTAQIIPIHPDGSTVNNNDATTVGKRMSAKDGSFDVYPLPFDSPIYLKMRFQTATFPSPVYAELGTYGPYTFSQQMPAMDQNFFVPDPA